MKSSQKTEDIYSWYTVLDINQFCIQSELLNKCI